MAPVPEIEPVFNLVTKIDQVFAVASVNVSNTLEVWMPYLEEAQEQFILPCIGETLLNDLLAELARSSIPDGMEMPQIPPDENKMKLIGKIRKPLVLYALWLGADEFGVSISPQGIQVIESPSHKTAPQYKVQNLKETWIRRANKALDNVLKYIDENAELFPDYHPQDNDLFIRNTFEFNREVDIRGSRRVFVELKPIIRSIEKKYFKPTLSEGLFNELKDALTSGDELSEDHATLLALIRPALAHLTIARALQEISIDILDWGIFETAQNTFENISTKSASNSDRISIMSTANEKDGEAELKDLQIFLDTNASADKYAPYFNSSRYVGVEQAKERNEFMNKSDNSFFLV